MYGLVLLLPIVLFITSFVLLFLKPRRKKEDLTLKIKKKKKKDKYGSTIIYYYPKVKQPTKYSPNYISTQQHSKQVIQPPSLTSTQPTSQVEVGQPSSQDVYELGSRKPIVTVPAVPKEEVNINVNRFDVNYRLTNDNKLELIISIDLNTENLEKGIVIITVKNTIGREVRRKEIEVNFSESSRKEIEETIHIPIQELISNSNYLYFSKLTIQAKLRYNSIEKDLGSKTIHIYDVVIGSIKWEVDEERLIIKVLNITSFKRVKLIFSYNKENIEITLDQNVESIERSFKLDELKNFDHIVIKSNSNILYLDERKIIKKGEPIKIINIPKKQPSKVEVIRKEKVMSKVNIGLIFSLIDYNVIKEKRDKFFCCLDLGSELISRKYYKDFYELTLEVTNKWILNGIMSDEFPVRMMFLKYNEENKNDFFVIIFFKSHFLSYYFKNPYLRVTFDNNTSNLFPIGIILHSHINDIMNFLKNKGLELIRYKEVKEKSESIYYRVSFFRNYEVKEKKVNVIKNYDIYVGQEPLNINNIYFYYLPIQYNSKNLYKKLKLEDLIRHVLFLNTEQELNFFIPLYYISYKEVKIEHSKSNNGDNSNNKLNLRNHKVIYIGEDRERIYVYSITKKIHKIEDLLNFIISIYNSLREMRGKAIVIVDLLKEE